jgi:hypothetical protein
VDVKIQCPCGKGMRLPEEKLPRRAECPRCGLEQHYTAADIVKRYIDQESHFEEPDPPKPPPPKAEPPKPAPPPPPAVQAPNPGPAPEAPPIRKAEPPPPEKPRTARAILKGSAEAARFHRRNLMIGSVGGTAALLLIMLVVFFSVSPAKKPRLAPPPPPPEAPAAAPSSDAARHEALLARWRGIAARVEDLPKNPASWESIVADLEAVARDGKGTEFEEKARASIEKVRAWAKENAAPKPLQRAKPAPAAEPDLVSELARAFEEGRVGDVIDTIETNLKDSSTAPALRERLAAEKEKYLKRAQERYDALLARAKELVLAGSQAEAYKLLRQAAFWSIPAISGRVQADLDGLVDFIRSEKEKRAAAVREAREKKKRDATAAYQAVLKAAEILRAGKEAEAGRLVAPTPEAQAAVRGMVAAWQSIGKQVEAWVASRPKDLKAIRFRMETVSFPIKRVEKGEVVFAFEGGGEYSKPLRDLAPSEVKRCLEAGGKTTPEGMAGLALLRLIEEDFEGATAFLDRGGAAAAPGLQAAVGVALPYLEAAGEDLLAEAQSVHAAGKCERARDLFRRLFPVAEVRDRALKAHARCSIDVKSFAGAFESIEKLVAGKYMDDDILGMVKVSFDRCTMTDRVLESLKTLYRHYPGRPEIAQSLFSTYRQAHQYPQALEFIDQALKDDPANYVLHAEGRILRELLLPDWKPAAARRAGRYLIFGQAAEEAATTLTAVYDEYSRYFPAGRNEEIPLYVRIFGSEGEMKAWLARLHRVEDIYREEIARCEKLARHIRAAQASGRNVAAQLRGYVEKGSAHARTVDPALVAGVERWIEGRSVRVTSPGELDAFLVELTRFLEALTFGDAMYLDVLLVRYGDAARWESYAAKSRGEFEKALREARPDTMGYLESYNLDTKGDRVAPAAFEAAFDRALASKDLLLLAETRFLMSLWRIGCTTGESENVKYVLARLGLQVASEFAKRIEKEIRLPPRPVEVEAPPPSAPGGGVLVQYGAYVPNLKELVLWRSDQMTETLRHEAFHQFLDGYVSECPPWFNEGFASYFEVARGGRPADHPIRIREIAERFQNAPPLEKLLSMSLREFQTYPDLSVLYAQSWSFIHYLIKSGNRWMLDRYFDALSAGRGPAEAFREAFETGKVDFATIDAQWRAAARSQKY